MVVNECETWSLTYNIEIGPIAGFDTKGREAGGGRRNRGSLQIELALEKKKDFISGKRWKTAVENGGKRGLDAKLGPLYLVFLLIITPALVSSADDDAMG